MMMMMTMKQQWKRLDLADQMEIVTQFIFVHVGVGIPQVTRLVLQLVGETNIPKVDVNDKNNINLPLIQFAYNSKAINV